MKNFPLAASVVLLVLMLTACGGKSNPETGKTSTEPALAGTVAIDGSSTVFPITEAVAEEFRVEAPEVRVTVGVSGTGGGFKKFCAGETDISDASRPIKPSEVEACGASAVKSIELPVAFDGLSVVVSLENDFVTDLTVEELRRIWLLGSTVATWHDVRDSWPAEEISLYGPGTDSGTFDYFVEAVLGKKGEIRNDFSASEDDNVLVQGVAGDRGALGFFGYAYYLENKDRIRVVPIDNGDGPVEPNDASINDGRYQPLSRPIFIYVNPAKADASPAVQRFVEFYLDHAASLVGEVGYVPLPAEAYQLARKRFADRVTGSVFGGEGSKVGVRVEDLLALEGADAAEVGNDAVEAGNDAVEAGNDAVEAE